MTKLSLTLVGHPTLTASPTIPGSSADRQVEHFVRQFVARLDDDGLLPGPLHDVRVEASVEGEPKPRTYRVPIRLEAVVLMPELLDETAPPPRRCPFCGGFPEHAPVRDTTWSMYCLVCDAIGPAADSPDEALSLWNGRSR